MVTIGNRLTRNVFWSLIGNGVPIVLAIIAIPILIKSMGNSRFAVLTISWMVVGYFSLFDMSIGRALTKLISEKLAEGLYSEIPELVWTALIIMAVLGNVAAIMIFLFSPLLVKNIFNIPIFLQIETLKIFHLLAVSIPFVISANGLRGILEAHQRFDIINFVRIPMGILNYIGPLAMLNISNSLTPMIAILVGTRIVSWALFVCICLKFFPSYFKRRNCNFFIVKRLLFFGGWMTVSSIVGPILLYLGRIFIAMYISMEAVAYFVTPYEIITKLLLIPGIIVTVLFPIFTQLFQQGIHEVNSLYKKTMLVVLLIMLPLSGLTFFLSEIGLAWWINKDFAMNGYRVAQFLSIGVFINSFGHVAQVVVQSYGRPDLTAKLHLLELVLYLPYLWWLIGLYGISGAAMAWLIRVSFSTIVLTFIANRCVSESISKKY